MTTTPPLLLQHERVDDLPLLWGVLTQLRLPELLDRHLGQHHLHQGLSNGHLAAVWIAHILSEANHCKAPVRDWARAHQHTLQTLLGQPLRDVDFSDDRLAIVLRRLHEAPWHQLEADLWQASCEVYALPCEAIRLDSTTSYGYHDIDDDGLMQFGHSKDHRPDLPQLKLMAAAAQPSSHVIACDIVPGNTADDVLYLPLIDRLRRQLRQSGLLYLGDSKMAALHIRADIHCHHDYYLTVLPRTGDNAALIETWIDDIVAGKHALQSFARLDKHGQSVLYARGAEFERRCQTQVDGKPLVWTERVQLICTEAWRQHQEQQLQRRLQSATEQLQRLTPAPGRGRRQQRDEESLQQAVAAVLQEHDVVGLLQVQWRGHYYRTGTGAVQWRYGITSVDRVEEAIAAAKARCGWRVQVTNVPLRRASLEASMLLYNGGWSMERSFHVVKDRPLGIQPLYVREEDQIDGLTKLLMIALRVLTWLELRVRNALAEEEETLTGLYEGQPRRATSRPTAVRLLRAVSRLQVTLTQVQWREGSCWSLSKVPPLLERILELLQLPLTLYTALANDTG